MDSALVDAGSYNAFHRGLVQVQSPDQQHMEWWGIPVLHCQSVPSFVFLGLGILLLPFVLQSAVPYIQTSNFCATNIWVSVTFKQQTFVQQTVWISVHSNSKLLCNRQSEFQSIQTSNFCATEIEFQYIQTANICATDIRFQLGLLGVFKIPKNLQSFGTAKIYLICVIFIVLNISSTFGLWVIWRL